MYQITVVFCYTSGESDSGWSLQPVDLMAGAQASGGRRFRGEEVHLDDPTMSGHVLALVFSGPTNWVLGHGVRALQRRVIAAGEAPLTAEELGVAVERFSFQLCFSTGTAYLPTHRLEPIQLELPVLAQQVVHMDALAQSVAAGLASEGAEVHATRPDFQVNVAGEQEHFEYEVSRFT